MSFTQYSEFKQRLNECLEAHLAFSHSFWAPVSLSGSSSKCFPSHCIPSQGPVGKRNQESPRHGAAASLLRVGLPVPKARSAPRQFL